MICQLDSKTSCCIVCGRHARSLKTFRVCTEITQGRRVQNPGTELSNILRDWLGIESTPTCSCNAMARKMDERGPDWCRSDEGMAEILGVMRTEHAKRKTILPWSDIAARQLVLLACRRAAG
jgi:hypothetical protein